MLVASYVPPPITEDEIKDVVDLGLAEKAIEEDERRMVHGALEFDDIPIRTVMTPKLTLVEQKCSCLMQKCYFLKLYTT